MNTQTTSVSTSMIFITGASRSGTTLMSQALGRHSNVSGLQEMHYFGSSYCPNGRNRRMSEAEANAAVENLFSRQRRSRLSTGYTKEGADIRQVLHSVEVEPSSADIFSATVDLFARRAGKSVPCEQTPRNIYYARSLLDQFPQARFVHMVRDPHAVMASQKVRWRKRAMLADPTRMSRISQARAWFNYHPYIVSRLWNRATSEALQLQDHPRFQILKFEDLISDPEKTIRDLCAFLNLVYEPDMLNVEHTNSSHVVSTGRHTGFTNVSADMARSMLTRTDVAVVSHRCAGPMTQLGYQFEIQTLSRKSRCALLMGYVCHLAGALLLNPRRLLIQGRAMWQRRRSSWQVSASSDPETTLSLYGSTIESAPETSKSVFGLSCMDADLDVAAKHLVEAARTGRKTRVAFINAHCLNTSVTDPELQRALTSADIRFADGVGMLIASLLHGNRLRHNVNGTDLFPFLCDRAADADVSMAFLGGAPGVADECVVALLRSHPGLRVVYSHDGFFQPGEDAQILDAINASGAKILLVAMGVPLQERWIRDHGGYLTAPVLIGVGGLFDFVSGRVPRAPSIVRSLKAEWLFRFIVEPNRLFSRYVFGNPLFLIRASRYALTGRLWPVKSWI